MDPRIRIHTKMSRIRNTAKNCYGSRLGSKVEKMADTLLTSKKGILQNCQEKIAQTCIVGLLVAGNVLLGDHLMLHHGPGIVLAWTSYHL
jgi:hypothetical protein